MSNGTGVKWGRFDVRWGRFGVRWGRFSVTTCITRLSERTVPNDTRPQ
ncbi:MAG: hypothetical protein IKR58_04435 [Lachnospiraceae bacterium]|nr:hypothetical protein [Lachnospiraceae bacterium]